VEERLTSTLPLIQSILLAESGGSEIGVRIIGVDLSLGERRRSLCIAGRDDKIEHGDGCVY
jgi:hypothetical protein